MFYKQNLLFRIAIFVLITLTMTSCFMTKIEKPEDRAVARWNALIAQDWEKAYSYETPAYRKTYTTEQFKNSFGGAVDWKEIELSNVKVDGNIADIDLSLIVAFSDSGADMLIPSGFSERWLLQNDQWWHTAK